MRKLIILAFLFVLATISPTFAAEFAVVQCAAPTSNGGTVDCTSVGFGTPKAAYVWGTRGTANGTAVSIAGLFLGSFDGAGAHQLSYGFTSDNNLATSDTGSVTDANSAYITLNNAHVQDGDCTASTITDGIRLTCADGAPSAYQVNVLLIGGSGVSNVFSGTATGSGTQNNTTAVTSPSFTPDLIIGMTAYSNVGSRMSIGFATLESGPTIVQKALGWNDNDNQGTMAVAARVASNRWLTNPIGLGTLELTSFDANGFTVTTRDAATSIPFQYLAIKFSGLAFKLGTSTFPASTGAESITGIGFRPQLVINLSSDCATVDSNCGSDDGEVVELGMCALNGCATGSIYSEDSGSPSITESVTGSGLCQSRKDGAAYRVCTLSGFTADGADINLTTNAGGTKQRILLFVQTSAVATRRTQAPWVLE